MNMEKLIEIKKKISNFLILFVLSVVLIIVSYKSIFVPISVINNLKEDKKNKETEITNKSEELAQTEKILQKKIAKTKKEKEKYDELKNEYLSKSFKNIGILEHFIDNLSASNNVKIEIIGGIENIDISGEFQRVCIPYIVSGNEKNIFDFLGEIENTQYILEINSTPILLEKEKDNIKITFKLLANIMEENNTYEENNKSNSKNVYSIKDIINSTNSYTLMSINNKNYIILKQKNGKREIYVENDEIEKDGNKYFFETNMGKVYLKKKGA